MRPRAVLFDFNGTLSEDEPILCEIYQELFAEHGVPLSAEEYFAELAGLSDLEIVERRLGREHPAFETVVAERVRRYREHVADGSSVPPRVREAVAYAAGHVPCGVVSGAFRSEIVPVLEAAGIARHFRFVVAADDVERGKPDPEGYERALALLDGGVEAGEVVVFEDTEAGIAAAKDAGMYAVAVLGTLAPERLAAADEVVAALDLDVAQRLLP